MAQYGPSVDGFKWLKPRLDADGMFYIVRKLNGKKKEVSLGTKDQAEAEALYIEQIGVEIPERRDMRCKAAWEHYINNPKSKRKPVTTARYKTAWDVHCADLLDSIPVSKVTPEDIIAVLTRAENRKSAHTGKPLSQSSLRNIYVALSAFFNSCTKVPTRYRFDNPVNFIGEFLPEAPVAAELGDDYFVTDEEIDRMAKAVSKTKHRSEVEEFSALVAETIVLLSPELGTRIGETLGIMLTDVRLPLGKTWGEVHLKRQIAFRPKADDPATWFGPLKGQPGTVGDRARVAPLSAFGRQTLQRYIDTASARGWLRPGGLLFPTSKGTPRSTARMSERIRAAAENAGIDRRVVSHFFRHTMASRMLEAGATFEEIGEVLGNSPEVAKSRYAHRVNRDAFNEKIAAMGRRAQ